MSLKAAGPQGRKERRRPGGSETKCQKMWPTGPRVESNVFRLLKLCSHVMVPIEDDE
jgi:hypothetical protein